MIKSLWVGSTACDWNFFVSDTTNRGYWKSLIDLSLLPILFCCISVTNQHNIPSEIYHKIGANEARDFTDILYNPILNSTHIFDRFLADIIVLEILPTEDVESS